MSQVPASLADLAPVLDRGLLELIHRIGGDTEPARFLAQFLADCWCTTTGLIAQLASTSSQADALCDALRSTLAGPRLYVVMALLMRLFTECKTVHPSSSSSSASSTSPSGASSEPTSPASALRRESPAESPDPKKARKIPKDKFSYLNPAHASFWRYFVLFCELREDRHNTVVCCPGCSKPFKSENANNFWAHLEKCKKKEAGVLLEVPATDFAVPTAPLPPVGSDIVRRFAALSLPVKVSLPVAWRMPVEQFIAAQSVGSAVQVVQVAVLPQLAAARLESHVHVPDASNGDTEAQNLLSRTDGSFGSAGSLSQLLDSTFRVEGSTIDPQAVFRQDPGATSLR